MSVTALDLRDERGRTRKIEPPAAIEAEQALLGALLYQNDAFHLIEGVTPETFYEPFHGRLFAAINMLIRRGQLAEPFAAIQVLGEDPALEAMGGLEYLALMIDRAPPAVEAPHYAKVVTDAALRRQIMVVAGEMVQAASDGAAPASEVLEFAERSLLGMSVVDRRAKLISAGQAAADVLAWLDTPSELARGVSTAIEPLDKHLGPLLAGDLIVLAGRPSMGKSALGGVLGLNIAAPGIAQLRPGMHHVEGPFAGVIELNGEMSTDQMARRHLTDICHRLYGREAPSYADIRRRRIGDVQRDRLGVAAAILSQTPLMSVKRTGLTLSALRSMVRRQAAEWARQDIPLGTVLIDHVGLLKGEGDVRSRYEEQTQISNGLKELADELQVPIIALAQLNRETEKRDNKRPTLADLRDSGAWEQDADVVIGVYRDAYYAQREPEPKKYEEAQLWESRKGSKTIEAILLKVREGETGTVTLWGDMPTNAIRGHAPDDGGFL